MPIWFKNLTLAGDWNDNPAADPATSTGGISLAAFAGMKMFVTAKGSDVFQTLNFGGVAMQGSTPSGFTTGWPNETLTGNTSLDDAKCSGSAVVIDSILPGFPPNTVLWAQTSYGMTQSIDGHTSGKFYIELRNGTNSVFSFHAGSGICREWPGINENFADDGRYSPGVDDGGVILGGMAQSNAFQTEIFASGATAVAAFSTMGNHHWFGIAIELEGAAPPAYASMTVVDLVVTCLGDANGGGVESPCTVTMFATVPTTFPSMGLRWSDTRGKTFGTPVAQAMSTNPYAQLQWNRTGMARDRVFELFWSAATDTALNGAFIEVVPSKT